MEDIRAEQIEALKTVGAYCDKLINAINNIVKELEVERLADTDEYLKEIITGLNWTFEVFNATKEVINEGVQVIDKEKVNASVTQLNEGVNAKDDKKIASALKSGIIDFVIDLKAAAEKEYA